MKTSPTTADLLVAEMSYIFGARFSVTDTGPNGESRWHYEPAAHLRSAARAFLKGVDRHRNGPFDHDIIAAIRKLQSGGADALR